MTGGAPPADLIRRIRVLRARQRIENVSRELLCDAEDKDAAERLHANVRTRLLLLLRAVDEEVWADRYRLADRAAAVYRGTSDVLHTRRTYIDIPEALLKEWEAVVEQLEVVAEEIVTGCRRPGSGTAD